MSWALDRSLIARVLRPRSLPESLGAPLLGRAYAEAGARIFLAAWGCGVEGGSDGTAAAAGPAACEGYTSAAWEVCRLFPMHAVPAPAPSNLHG